MTDREALYRAIVENPFDDTPRLILADMIEEDDLHRAAFIRIQCEIARLPQPLRCERDGQINGDMRYPRLCGRPYLPRCRCKPCSLRRREHNLLARHKADWDRGVLAVPLEVWQARLYASLGVSQTEAEFSPAFRPLELDSPLHRDTADLWLFDRQTITYSRGLPEWLSLPLGPFREFAGEWAQLPLRGIRLSDREPIDYGAGMGAMVYSWLRFSREQSSMPWEVPEILWADELGMGHPNPEEAHSALSGRCLAYLSRFREPVTV